MCGILGTPKFTDDTALMLPLIAYDMQSRGKDAWGATDGKSIIKHLGPLHMSWKWDYVNNITDWNSCIIHTRAASSGTGRKTENAHPFTYTGPDGLHVVGIHNGYIINHVKLGEEYKREYEVDSQHIWMHRAERRSWNELQGYGNLAWYENMPDEEPVMYIYRSNTEDLHVVRTGDGGIIFASELDILKLAADLYGIDIAQIYHVPEDIICKLTAENLFKTKECVSFHHFSGVVDAKRGELCGFVPSTPSGGTKVMDTTNPNAGTESVMCYKCFQRFEDHTRQLLCGDCYDKFYELWKLRVEIDKAMAESTLAAMANSVSVN